ncbi:MAG: hypothetical protein K6G24_10760 [Lachnospiraceae bacterium]|nr:hypothetical protein [Lachnospiraceae bacterium]
MYSIAYTIAYFLDGKGHWPSYIDWFMASCKANKSVDFYIFTDDHSLDKWENIPNINIVHMSFKDCINLIRNKLGDVRINTPYKLNDMKPAYRKIFNEWLEKYDFWAYGDCDLIFGNIRNFFSDGFLDKYDWFQILGNLQIIRNTEEVNNYYLLDRPEWSHHREHIWKNVINTEANTAFDEQTGMPMLIRENGKKIFWTRENFVNIYQEDKGYKKMIDNTVQHNTLFQYWKWENGSFYHIDKFTGKKTEYLYIHFSNRKINAIPYTGQQSAFITANAKITDTLRLADTFTGKDFFVAYAKKIKEYIRWHVTHPHGKDRSEL